VDNATHHGAGDTEASGDIRLALSASHSRSDGDNGVIRKLGVPVVLTGLSAANRSPENLFGVPRVPSGGDKFKVGESIVALHAILVVHLQRTWNWAKKRVGDKPVNGDRLALSVPANARRRVAVGIGRLLNEPVRRPVLPVPPVEHRPDVGVRDAEHARERARAKTFGRVQTQNLLHLVKRQLVAQLDSPKLTAAADFVKPFVSAHGAPHGIIHWRGSFT
jgi:hypothetical protein